jgi:zinc transport system ATP-binding protein
MPAEALANTSRGSAPLIAAEQVSRSFGRLLVLDHIDLAVHSGEIVTLIGPNGSGKTTLVRILLGLLPPSSGRVMRKPGLRVGYVPQRLSIDTTLPLTVRRFLNLTRRYDPQHLKDRLGEVDCADLIDASIHTLSGGELRRVMLARALLVEPDLLVLDEPMQGVDFTGQTALYHLLGKVRDRHGCGVLLVSHDLHLVMAETDQVVCLNHHVCCAGTPEAVSHHPEYRQLFGAMAEDIAVYRHHHDHDHAPGGEVLPLEGDDGHSHGAQDGKDRGR